MKLSQIVEALDAKVLTGDDLLEKDIDTCGASDLMSDILAGLSEGCILLTGLTTVQVIRTAMVAGVGAVVFVRANNDPGNPDGQGRRCRRRGFRQGENAASGSDRSGPRARIAVNLQPIFNVCIVRQAACL